MFLPFDRFTVYALLCTSHNSGNTFLFGMTRPPQSFAWCSAEEPSFSTGQVTWSQTKVKSSFFIQKDVLISPFLP